MTGLHDPYLPMLASVTECRPEVPGVVTLVIRLENPEQRDAYRFRYGQFNMLCLPGYGEVPISVMDQEGDAILHTIRAVGPVSQALCALLPGARIGIRGPFGNHWPLELGAGRDLVFVTAGLGCAPVIAAIRQAVKSAEDYHRILILQGVKYRHDLLWSAQYQAWRAVKNCRVLLAASDEQFASTRLWTFGQVTALFEQAGFNTEHCLVMMCGPEPMLLAAMQALELRGVDPACCYLSLERNMQCATGHCGHCQMGEAFICRQGPVFAYPQIRRWLNAQGV